MQRSPLTEDRHNIMPEKSEGAYNSTITERIRRASIIRSDTMEEGKEAHIEYDRVSEVQEHKETERSVDNEPIITDRSLVNVEAK